MNKSYLTAINRKTCSAPVRELHKLGKFFPHAKVLDYGCGHGADVRFLQDAVDSVNGYDPYWAPNSLLLRRQYSIVLCTYVLNVLDEDERCLVLGKLKKLTSSLGSIFITVRRDFKKDYMTKKGTRQYMVELPYIRIKENSQFCIYETSGIGRMR